MSASITFSITGIGLIGPGCQHWDEARAALRGGDDIDAWTHAPTRIPAPSCLPPAERRRAGSLVRLALSVAEQACAGSDLDLSQLRTVFSTSSGEPANCHALCETLTGADRLISPTRFTNSVHNAAAGYWHIAKRCTAPSTSLCGFDASWGAGLLEAAVQCSTSQQPVLMVSVDVPYPEPLHSCRPLPEAVGVALLLQPCTYPGSETVSVSGRAPTFSLSLAAARGDAHVATTPCNHPQLEALRHASPVGRAWPLLQALAATPSEQSAELYLDYLEGLDLRLSRQI
jgi:Beta-ketoacyl synthase, N-terminal domain